MDNYNNKNNMLTTGEFTNLPVFVRQKMICLTTEYARLDDAFYCKWQALIEEYSHLNCKAGVILNDSQLSPAVGISHSVLYCPPNHNKQNNR